MKIIAENKKAYFNYEILEKFEAGISLIGQEVKSIKTRGVSLTGSYVVLRDNEVFWIGINIPPYQPKNAPKDYNPARTRKLLLKKSEIKYLIGKTKQKGLTLVPLRVYTKNGKIKLEFGIAKGKKKADKRELIKKREVEREIQKELKTRG
ncbi:SsrA-binding protein SmpB [Patescibacteria group bacterium]|nr:SsrA-binding protein SmpB [Patescibacteria group bacterium]